MKSQPLHIIIALHRFEGGGAERQALHLAVGLRERNYQVTVVGFGNGGGLAWQWFQSAGVTLVALGFLEKLVLEGKGLKSWLLKIRYQRRLISKIRTLEGDYLIPFTYAPNVIYGELWRKMGVKGCCWNQRDKGVLFKGTRREIFSLNNCTHITTNSTEGLLFLKRFTSRSVKVIYNGVAPFEKTDLVKENSPLRVIMIANLQEYKDHLTLLKAWKLVIADWSNYDIQLLLVGRVGKTAPSINKYIDENQLHTTVRCTGEVNDIESALLSCSIGVFSSVDEGLPNGILECMAAGLPVVATRMRGSEDALGPDYPYLAAPGNEIEMAEHINTFLKYRQLRIKWGIINNERINSYFNISKMVECYMELIKGTAV